MRFHCKHRQVWLKQYNSPIWRRQLPMTVLVHLPRLGMRKLYARPGRIDTEASTLDQSVAVTDTNNIWQGEISAKLLRLGPRHPQHASRLEMTHQCRKVQLHFGLRLCKKVNIVKLPMQSLTGTERRKHDGIPHRCRSIFKKCVHACCQPHLLRHSS